MTNATTLRAARRLAARKGLVLRKLRGGEAFALAHSAPRRVPLPPLIFDTLSEVLDEIRMR